MIFYTDKEWSALNSIRQAVESKVSREVEGLLVQAWDAIQARAEERQSILVKQNQEFTKILEAANSRDIA